MYGTQTTNPQKKQPKTFENDVEMYGTQTKSSQHFSQMGLRMM